MGCCRPNESQVMFTNDPVPRLKSSSVRKDRTRGQVREELTKSPEGGRTSREGWQWLISEHQPNQVGSVPHLGDPASCTRGLLRNVSEALAMCPGPFSQSSDLRFHPLVFKGSKEPPPQPPELNSLPALQETPGEVMSLSE